MDLDRPANNIIELDPDQDLIKQCQIYSEAFRKLVNIGTHVLESNRKNTISVHHKKGVIYAFFRRIIEVLDAASVQYEAGIIIPVMNDLRIILEATLQLEYLYKDPATIDKKVKYVLIMEIHNELIMHEKILNQPQYWQGKLDLPAFLAMMEGKLLLPFFDEIRPEYAALVTNQQGQRKMKPLKWYNINTSIADFAALTKELDKFDYYQLLYSPTSKVTHTTGIIDDGYQIQDDQLLIRKIRDKKASGTVAVPLIRIALEAIDLVGKNLLYSDRGNYFLTIAEFKRKYRGLY